MTHLKSYDPGNTLVHGRSARCKQARFLGVCARLGRGGVRTGDCNVANEENRVDVETIREVSERSSVFRRAKRKVKATVY